MEVTCVMELCSWVIVSSGTAGENLQGKLKQVLLAPSRVVWWSLGEDGWNPGE